MHHIKFRSLGGGDDDPKALAAMCRRCHQDIHLYKLAVVAQGRRGANGKLTFRRTA